MLPPTSHLPSIKYISKNTVESLENAIQYLRLIYNPQVRGSRRRKAFPPASGGKIQDEQSLQQELDALRTDGFERAYCIKWLTALIAQCEVSSETDLDLPECSRASPESNLTLKQEALVENAASLLATCAGTASAGLITRNFTFDLRGSPNPVTVELIDVPLDNQDYGSVGAQTWGGACVMAEMITEAPDAFGLPKFGDNSLASQNYWEQMGNLRFLELGAGTGLVSLVVVKTMEKILSQSQSTSNFTVDIVATDYYPSVLANLEHNVQCNFPASNSSSSTRTDQIRFRTSFLDWSTFCTLDSPLPILAERFDIIYGADIIYEAQHAKWIKECLIKLLRKPSSSSEVQPTFHLIIPLRATHAIESSTIEQVFHTNVIPHVDSDSLELVIKHKEIIICEAESGDDGEEVEYAYYKIGWS
ncbi:hypothetical protein GALMADRAFT_214789 [Galerina marginata CBS 339.88]|uniref:FAM86 N-terminal domain-containing protein n=1 Tax=Galerina marginata (strain CBS 339.88) TaxID=685588 RepID=A0A067STE9_GALM3|nr:hypothetical protein GALMADRAFT_214789 [Galerina marginata CBS 339.88]